MMKLLKAGLVWSYQFVLRFLWTFVQCSNCFRQELQKMHLNFISMQCFAKLWEPMILILIADWHFKHQIKAYPDHPFASMGFEILVFANCLSQNSSTTTTKSFASLEVQSDFKSAALAKELRFRISSASKDASFTAVLRTDSKALAEVVSAIIAKAWTRPGLTFLQGNRPLHMFRLHEESRLEAPSHTWFCTGCA